MPGVYSFSFKEDVVAKVAEYLLASPARRGTDFSRLAAVFPGKRPALFLRQELARRLASGFVPPRCFSIDELVEYVIREDPSSAPRVPLASLDACYLMYTLVRERAPEVLKGREHFSQFLPWARELISFIDHLDIEDVPSQELRGIQSKAAIGYDVPKSVNALLESVIAVREEYHQALAAQSAHSRGTAYLAAAAAGSARGWEEFDEVLFCGFFSLTKSEARLIRSVQERGKAVFFFQGGQKEWGELQKAAKEFSISIEPEGDAPQLPEIEIQAGFDTHSQVGLIRHRLQQAGGGSGTVVVMPDPEGVIPLLSEISGISADFNVSMGYPLKRSALFALLQSVYQCQSSAKDGAYYAKDYLKVLSHPLVKNLNFGSGAAVTRVLVHKVEEVLLGMEESPLGGSIFVGLDEICHCRQLYDSAMSMVKGMGLEVTSQGLKEVVEGLHGLLFSSWHASRTFGDFAGSLSSLVDALMHKSPLAGYPLNVAMAERIARVAEEASASRFSQEEFPGEEMFHVLLDALGHEAVSFSGSPLKGLQVLGLFETRLLHFDTVIIADLNESVLPRLTVYEPLIPREVMISLGLDRLEKEEEIQRYLFRRLVFGCRKALLIYEATPEKEKSRFLEELVWERQKQARSLRVFSVPRASFQVKVLPLKASIRKTPEHVERLKKMRYSASGLNTYLACPLQFYFQQVLGLKEKEDFLLDPEAKDVGTFLHKLFEEAFTPFLGKQPKVDGEFRARFMALFEERFAGYFEKKMRADAFMIKEVVAAALGRFIDAEAGRQVLQVAGLEKECTARLPLCGSAFEFKAVMDRIDRLRDGSILIIDYKTGGSDIMPEVDAGRIEEKGYGRRELQGTVKSFQLPLYIRLLGEQPAFSGEQVNACLYFVKSGPHPSQTKPLFPVECTGQQRSAAMAAYMKALEAMVAEILDPGVPFQADPAPRRCEYCAYAAMCR